ncbi:MAG: hypothetical protein HRF43_07215, partial [Phycisphaerae bacterium]
MTSSGKSCRRVVRLCACRPRWRWTASGISLLILLSCSGCPAVSNLPAPGELLTLREPRFGRPYLLYVPSRYREDRRWPLVVTCHGTRPADTAGLQMKEWKGLGEMRGFLVAAPELTAASALTPGAPEQIRRQLDDEQAILSMLSAIKAARSIDDAQVFITGWSAGCYVALFAGLRHPEVFRGISLRQGNFNPAFVEPCIPFLDQNQPIQVTSAELDLLRDEAKRCLDWLRMHGLDPTPLEQFSGHRRGPEPVFAFFADVIRNRPWARIEVHEDAADD